MQTGVLHTFNIRSLTISSIKLLAVTGLDDLILMAFYIMFHTKFEIEISRK